MLLTSNNIIMPRTVYTTTISLPKSMEKEIKAMAKQEGKTFSEFIRGTVRMYQMQNYRKRPHVSWADLNARLKKISTYGKSVNLSEFLIKDRQSH